jgi:hypothetical protein
MDVNARAKKAAEARKSASKSTTNINNNSSTSNSSNKSITLPKATDTTTFDKKDIVTNISGSIDFNTSNQTTKVNIPNLPVLTVDGIAASVIHTNVKTITDVRNPGFTEDEKCDQATFERAKNDYQDAIRYQQLIVWANTYKGEEYKAIASAAKAYTQGLIAATDIERAYQQFIELSKQQQITTQKGVEYIGQSHKTATVQAALPYTLADNESTLEKQRAKARKSFEEAKQANVELDDWLTSLKGKKDKLN